MKFKKAIRHTITIEPAANGGFFVTVGCGRFAFENGPSLLDGLKYYREDPDLAEKEYNKAICGPVAGTVTVGMHETLHPLSRPPAPPENRVRECREESAKSAREQTHNSCCPCSVTCYT